MTTLAARLSQLFAATPRFTPSGLANACRIKPPSVSDWLSGKTKSIRSEHLHAAADYLGVSAEWLATGQGPRERDAAAPPAAPALTPDERAMLDLWRGLGPDGKRSVQAVAHALAQPQVKRGKAKG